MLWKSHRGWTLHQQQEQHKRKTTSLKTKNHYISRQYLTLNSSAYSLPGFLLLGGLSLHLNHLIGSRMRISYCLFGTLPIGISFLNLGSGQLMTCPRTLFGQIWNMSLFGDSRAIRVLMPKYRPFRKSIFSWWRSGDSFSRLRGCRWADGWAIWWYHFGGGCDTLGGAGRA